jgi:prephenate dehydrogenase
VTGDRIGIAGLGLIGGSIALRAQASGARVSGFDLDPAAATRALELGAIARIEPSLEMLATDCDTLVIALPLGATAAALDDLGSRPQSSQPQLVIDVASVKAPLARFATSLHHFIGTHPMAGRERSGIDAADPRLFENATWAHVPHSSQALTAQVRSFIAGMGARPLEIDAVRHDAIVALTSHVPQAVSIALAAELARHMRSDPRVTQLCGPGMMSMLRLAGSPADLWSAIFSANAAPLATHLRAVAGALAAAAEGLDQGDTTLLMSYFEGARDAVGALTERFSVNHRS